jgi:O-acetyl-ADP-ribose deacetylase (regulator of RNase III)
VDDIGECVRNALRKADELRELGLKSILIPLLGTGQGRGDLPKKAAELINAAVAHLSRHEGCMIDTVYFLCWTEEDLAVCGQLLSKERALSPISEPMRSRAGKRGTSRKRAA